MPQKGSIVSVPQLKFSSSCLQSFLRLVIELKQLIFASVQDAITIVKRDKIVGW